jgi:2-polyprenyl-3-methyl-5-hydroxy-6-metoxy-1,4-benzoquinol methylase
VREIADPQAAEAMRGDGVFPVVRCQSCDLTYVSPRYNVQTLRHLYRDESLYGPSSDPDGRRRSYLDERQEKDRSSRRLLLRIEKYRDGGRLLDIGCGPGFFLATLEGGWQGEGLDPSPSAVRIADEIGVSVTLGEFEKGLYPAHRFDVVTMMQVLDHLPEPAHSLAECNRILDHEGLLILTGLVNIESYCARLFRDGYRLLAPNHLYYFSPATVAHMLSRAGFAIEEMHFPYWNTPYCNGRDLGRLVGRTASVLSRRLLGRSLNGIVSPPFYGNVMNIVARKTRELSVVDGNGE